MTNKEKLERLYELKKDIIACQLEKQKQERLRKLNGALSAICLTATPIVSNIGIENPLAKILLTNGLLISGTIALANYLDYPNVEDRIDYKISENKLEERRLSR
jgi:hypothetical protein